MNMPAVRGSPINEKSGSAAESEKWNFGCSPTCSYTWMAGSARGKPGRGRRFPTAIGMLKYCSVTVSGVENKEAVERVETGQVALYRREMKWKGGVGQARELSLAQTRHVSQS